MYSVMGIQRRSVALTTTLLLAAGLGVACSSGSPGAGTSGDVEESSRILGASGGILLTENGSSVSVARGALTHDVTIRIASDSSAPIPDDATTVGLTYLLGPEGQTFEAPVTVTLAFDPSELPEGESAADIVVLTAPRDSADYVPLDTTVVDSLHVSAQTSHFSHFVPAIVKRHANDALADMVEHFWSERSGFRKSSYWTNAQALDAVLDGVERTHGAKYTEWVSRIVAASENQFGGWLEPNYREVYFDDIAWMALALIRAHDDAVEFHLPGADSYLETAATLVDYTIDHGQSGADGPSFTSGPFRGIWANTAHDDAPREDVCQKHVTVEFSVAIGASGLRTYADDHAEGCWSVLVADPGDPASDFRTCSREGAPVKHLERPNYGYDDTSPEHLLSDDKADLAACAKGATGIGFEYMAYRGGWRLLPAPHLTAYIAELQASDDDVDAFWPGAYVDNGQLRDHPVYPMINISPSNAKTKIEEDGPAICDTIDDDGYFGIYVGHWETTKIPDDDPRLAALGNVLDHCTKRASHTKTPKLHKTKTTAANFGSALAAARLSERRSSLTDAEVRKRGLHALRDAAAYRAFAIKVYDYWHDAMVQTSCDYTGAWVYHELELLPKDGKESWEPQAENSTVDQGIGIGAALAISAIDAAGKKATHLGEARAMADFLVAHEVEDDVLHDSTARVEDHELHGCRGSCEGWKGVAFRYLTALYRETDTSKYFDVLHASATAIFAMAYDKEAKRFGTDWSEPFGKQPYFAYPERSNRGGQLSLAANASAVMATELFASPTLNRSASAPWKPEKSCSSSPPPPPDGGGGSCSAKPGAPGCFQNFGSGASRVCDSNWSTFPGFTCSDDPGYSAGSCDTTNLFGCCVTTTVSPTSSGPVTTTQGVCYYDASAEGAKSACHGGSGESTMAWSSCPP
jgi:predicted alpha-1,6-mannanase (GH76 family)